MGSLPLNQAVSQMPSVILECLALLLLCGPPVLAQNTRPYKVQRFFANGQVSAEWWERQTANGDTQRLWQRGTIHFYSNGVKSAEYYSGDDKLSRHYSPTGKPISHSEFYEYYLRDRGDGTFASTLPRGDGRPSPLAKEYSERPRHTPKK